MVQYRVFYELNGSKTSELECEAQKKYPLYSDVQNLQEKRSLNSGIAEFLLPSSSNEKLLFKASSGERLKQLQFRQKLKLYEIIRSINFQ
jgi:hypothetical protein